MSKYNSGSVGQVGDGLCEACRNGNVQMPLGTVASPEDAAEFDRAGTAAEAESPLEQDQIWADYALGNARHTPGAVKLLNAKGWMGGKATNDDVRDLIRRTGREERAEALWRVGGECEQYVADYVLTNTGTLAEAVELLNARGSRHAMGTPNEREIRAEDVRHLMRNTGRLLAMANRWPGERGRV